MTKRRRQGWMLFLAGLLLLAGGRAVDISAEDFEDADS